MIDVSIKWEDKVTDRIKKFGENAGNVLDIILRGLSRNFRNHVRKMELSGQMLARRTGELQESVHHGKLRGRRHVFGISAMPKLANIYEHLGGAVIKAKKAAMLRWWDGSRPVFAKQVALPYRPFWTHGVASFDFNGGFVKMADKVIAKEIRRQGLGDES
jgi:hypothetical protein